MTRTSARACLDDMLDACNANNDECRENGVLPVQESSPRAVYADAAAAFHQQSAAGALRLALGHWAANDILISCMYSSVDMDRIHFEEGLLVL